MSDLAVTEYSAVALLFVLVVAAARFALKWVEGYNEARLEREKAEQARSDRDYEDRRRLSERLTELIAADAEARVRLVSTLEDLALEVRQANAAGAATCAAVERLARRLAEE